MRKTATPNRSSRQSDKSFACCQGQLYLKMRRGFSQRETHKPPSASSINMPDSVPSVLREGHFNKRRLA